MASDAGNGTGNGGAGPGGICMAIKLLEAGIDAFTIFERSPSIGGTWFHNTYPGCACDVPSALYSYSFEIKRDWSRPYATQPEILEYFEHCVEKYGLAPHICLNTGIESAHWDDERAVWHLVTEPGDEHDIDVLVSAIGMFNGLHWPSIPGVDAFTGSLFHSARWRNDHDLTGERVAVIGSAASAVQFVPEIAPKVAQLHVFQRTPNWVMPKDDVPYTAEEIERIDGAITFSDPQMVAVSQAMAANSMLVVEDPDVRAKLTPDFPHGCKRPLTSNDWYPTFNRPNVELVTDAIDRITADGVVTADGVCREVDTIIIATGFETTKYLSAIEVTGRGGRSLTNDWRDGAHAYLGVTTAGYPNLFMLYGPNTNNGSILYMIEHQVGYAMRHLERMRSEELTSIDVRPDVVGAYNAALQHDLDGVEVWQAGCNGYYRGPNGTIVTQWPHSMTEYEVRTTKPDFDAYEVHR